VASDRTQAAIHFRTKPLYLQVRDALIERIVSGDWKPGAGIPNESDLAREFALSIGTVRKALDLLEGERVLSRKHGRGTFVNAQTSDALASRFASIRAPDGKPIEGDAKTIDVVEAPTNEDERRRLELETRDRVYRVRRVRLYGGRAFMVEEVSLPVALFPGLLERAIEHRIVVLAQLYGILLGKATERISIDRVPAAIAGSLGIPPNTPTLLLDRLLLTLDGRPVEWRMAHCYLREGFYLAEIG
jgi:GntR family transcriptional regulator